MKRLWGKLLAIWAFGLFPVLVLIFAGFQIEQIETENRLGIERLLQERRLNQLLKLDDDTEMVARSIQRVFHLMDRASPARRRVLLGNLHRLFPNAFDLYVFDPQGKQLPEFSSTRYGRRASEMVMDALRQSIAIRTVPPARETLVNDMFHTTTSRAILNGRGKCASLAVRAENGACTWNWREDSPTAVAGFMAIIHPGQLRKNRALRSSIRALSSRVPGQHFGYIRLEEARIAGYPAWILARPEFREAVLAGLSQFSRQLEGPGFHCTLKERSEGGYLFAWAPIPRFFPPVVTGGLAFVCVLWLLVVFRHAWGEDAVTAVPLTQRLIGLFLFAVGLPSLVLLIGGYGALRDHSRILRENLGITIREKLRAFDRQMPLETRILEKRLVTMINRVQKAKTMEERVRILQRTGKREDLLQLLLVDREGKCHFQLFHPPNPLEAGRLDFALKLCKETLRRANNEKTIDGASLMADTTEAFLNSVIGQGGSFEIDRLVGGSGHFESVGIMGDSIYLFTGTLQDPSGKHTHLIMAQLGIIHLERRFLKRFFPVLARQAGLPWRLNAISEWRTKFPDFVLSPDDHPQAFDLSQEVARTRGPVTKILRSKGEEHLWYAVKLQNISKYTLVSRVSLEPFRLRIETLWQNLLLFSLLMLFSTGVIGALLSRQIVKPLGDLSGGLQAIQVRDFEHRVPVRGHDELGVMAGLMNNLIEGMGDLEVARAVQENLFPQAILEAGNCAIYGRSRAMRDIGGDYFDYFLLPDGRIQGLVGDVSGHGVAAALIMGMAKCAMNLEEMTAKPLVQMMTSFDRFLIRSVQRKKMMTAFLFRIDPVSGVMEWANAGHNFPFWYHAADGSVTELEQQSFPLGIRGKPVWKQESVTLAPGDALLFYTDGVTEARNAAEEMLDYERAREWFAEEARGSATEVVERLFARVDGFTAGTEASDDISLICLTFRAKNRHCSPFADEVPDETVIAAAEDQSEARRRATAIWQV